MNYSTLFPTFSSRIHSGHNTDGKYFVTSNKLAYRSELSPRKVQVWIEKARDGRITPVVDVEVRDIACGINHTVCISCNFSR